MTIERIQAAGITVIRNGKAILDVDELAVRSSEILAVVGPNGAGKSTLIQVLGLLLRPDRGQVIVGGETVTKSREQALRKKLACVFQSPHLLDKSVRANVELGLRLRGVPAQTRHREAERWLGALGLEGLVDRRARTLSGGEAQRVNLARALALGPEVLLLDEPLGGLDAPTRHTLIDELGPLIRQGAGSGLLVTHDRRVALALGDRVAVMLSGRVSQIGPPEEVFARPENEEVARFVGVENLFEAEARGTEIHVKDAFVLRGTEEIHGKVTVCLRAEEVRVSRTDPSGEEPNRLEGKLTRISRRGVGFALEVDVGITLMSRITRADLAVSGLEAGQRVIVTVRPRGLHCMPHS